MEKVKPRFRADIQGLRAIAVLAVVAFHCGVPRLNGGFVGVDIFFVLSGFLITGMLLREADGPRGIDLVQFYARRMRRLLPASALMVVVTAAVSAAVLSANEVVWFARAARATSLYMANVFFTLNSLDYFGQSVKMNPLLHMWSLAVEEQFYVVWPIVILVCLRFVRSKRLLVTVLIIGSAASLVFGIWASYHRPAAAFYELPSRAWEFGLGALVNFVPVRHVPRTPILPGVALCSVILCFFFIGDATRFPGWVALLPTVGTGLLIPPGLDKVVSPIQALLTSRPLQVVGDVSYSWYLWHWPFLVICAALFPNVSVIGRLGAATLAFGAAWLTFRGIENPIRFNRLLVVRPKLTITLSVLTTIGCVALAIATARYGVLLSQQPQLALLARAEDDIANMDRSQCVSLGTSSEVKTCDAGDGSSQITVVLAGDSHAIQWFNPLRDIAKIRGWHLRTFLKSGCPLADIPIRTESADHILGCTAWRSAAIRQIRDALPTLIIIGNATNYVNGKELNASRVTLSEWQQGITKTLQRLSESTATVVLLRDTPTPPFDVPSCLGRAARHTWFPGGCAFPAEPALHGPAFAAEVEAARGIPNVQVLDLTKYFCDRDLCWPDHAGVVTYRDDDHITGSYANSLAMPLGNLLQNSMQAREALRYRPVVQP